MNCRPSRPAAASATTRTTNSASSVLGDLKRFEQVALAIAEVLGADQLEVDAEHGEGGGVAAELGAWCGHLEREAPGVAVVGRERWWRGRRGRLGWLGWPLLPRAERALGDRERRAELARGRVVVSVQAVERADELVLDAAAL